MIFLEADLSQVEARVELMLAAGIAECPPDVAKECVRLATAHPAEFDIHRYSASVCFGKSEADVLDTEDHPERYLGKRMMHGFMRGMGAQTMSDKLLIDGLVVTPEECSRRLAMLARRLPAIPEVYFPDTRKQLMRYRGLGNTWGRIWRCEYQRFEDPLYGKGYSFQPVSEAVDLINQCGFLPLRNAIALRRAVGDFMGRPVPRINVHGHDSLLISAHPDDAWPIAAFLERTMGKHIRHYKAGPLQVPVTYKIGCNWKGDVEFKRLPSQREMRDAAWASEAKAR